MKIAILIEGSGHIVLKGFAQKILKRRPNKLFPW